MIMCQRQDRKGGKRGRAGCDERFAYLLLDNLPFLAGSCSEGSPDFPAHGKILLGHALELSVVPVIGVSPLGEALVALAAGVASLLGEVELLDLGPVQALGPGGQELVVVTHRPSTRAGAVGRREGHWGCGRASVDLLVGWSRHGRGLRGSKSHGGRASSSGGRHGVVSGGGKGHALLVVHWRNWG